MTNHAEMKRNMVKVTLFTGAALAMRGY